jgi:Restriction endonuclease
MSNIRTLDMLTVDDLFIDSGYVLNFSDRTYATFFAEELKVNIDDPKYFVEGGSKGKRLRYFLRVSDNALAVKTLKALWEYREAIRVRNRAEEKVLNAKERLAELLGRLGDTPPARKSKEAAKPVIEKAKFAQLQSGLMALGDMNPQERGFAFERYLKELFETFGMEPRSAFRLVGEQIDGSFLLGTDTYLLEAKWQNELTGAADLHVLNGKLLEKATWARGLFLSYTGFSEPGLQAFGRGKKVVCLDGADLSEVFIRGLSLPEVLHRKVRRAAETGSTFVRVRDLF